MARLDQIHDYVEQKTAEVLKSGQRPGVSATEVAEDLQMQRSDVSAILNKLYRLGYIDKVGSKPVLYFSSHNEEPCQDALSPDCHTVTPSSPDMTPQTLEARPMFDAIIGNKGSMKMQIELAKAAVVYPPHGLHTLICGEAGVGKSLLAEEMWRYAVEVCAFAATEKEKIPFVTFYCSEYADNPQLLLAQLFGYMKGAFTGADVEHDGLVDKAEGGILFLDEIHRLPPVGQELLFMLIDKGIYRRMGETGMGRKAHLMLIGATSEDVNSTLLTTFRRRIPLQITVPTLNERPIKERIALIVHFVEQEAKRLALPIWISGQAIKVFSFYNCPSNIGELRNDLRLCCAKSYLSYLANAGDKLVIDVDSIPQKIFSMVKDEEVTEASVLRPFNEGLLIEPGTEPLVQNLLNEYELQIDLYGFVDKKVDYYRQRRMTYDEVEQAVSQDLEKYFYSAVQTAFKPKTTNIPTSIIQEDIWDAANELLNDASRKLNSKFGRKTLVALALHMQQFKERVASGRIIYNPHLKKIEAEHSDAYQVALENAAGLSRKLGVELPPDELGFISMFLTQAFADAVKQRIGVVVVAHGRATAQSMAEVANNLLGTDHIKALDIPLHKSTSKTVEELQNLIVSVDEGKGVLLLVDMGFLVTMETTLTKAADVPLRVIPNVTTALVLEAGRRVLTVEESLEQAAENIRAAYGEYADALMLKSDDQEPVNGTILAVCLTGIGTAKKIEELLKEHVPLAKSMDIVTVGAADDVAALTEGLGPKLKLIVGNMDYQIGGVPFVHVSELLTPGGIDHINDLLARGSALEKQSQTKIWQKGDSFKLLAGQLNKFVKTLPTQQVAICCEAMVNRYEQLLCSPGLPLDAVNRIYLHTACMFDRISAGRPLSMPEWGEQIQTERAKEFAVLKSLVNEVSSPLHLNVSDAEICYFLIALPEQDGDT